MRLIASAGRRTLYLWLACVCLAYGQSFVPVDVTSELNGLDIEYSTGNVGSQLILSVRNKEAFAVACHALFNNGPQTPVERRVVVEAEKNSQMTVPLLRSPTRVRVDLQCDRAAEEKPASED